MVISLLLPLFCKHHLDSASHACSLVYFQQPRQGLAHSRHAINTCLLNQFLMMWRSHKIIFFPSFSTLNLRAEFSHSNRGFSWTSWRTSWPLREKKTQKPWKKLSNLVWKEFLEKRWSTVLRYVWGWQAHCPQPAHLIPSFADLGNWVSTVLQGWESLYELSHTGQT